MADVNFEDMIAKITQNPDLMKRIKDIKSSSEGKDSTAALPEIISLIAPVVGKDDEGNDEPVKEATVIKDAPDSKFSLPFSQLSEKISKNSNLLLALKPYLSKERGDIIDSIVKMAQVADLMKLAK